MRVEDHYYVICGAAMQIPVHGIGIDLTLKELLFTGWVMFTIEVKLTKVELGQN